MKKVLIIMAIICMAFSVSAQNKYAVLITGDYAAKNVPEQDRWKSNSNGETNNSPMLEFWNDTYLMWELLQANGYSRENIFVLFADGVDYQSQCPRYQSPEGITVTNFAATITNVTNVFTGFRYGTNGMPQLTENDFLFVWVFDHGGASNGHSYFYLIDGSMSDTQFAALLDPLPAHRKAYWMQQCHGGGFADELSANNTVFIAACQDYQLARRADNRTNNGTPAIENENCEGVVCPHGEFNFHMFSVTNQESPAGYNQYDNVPYSTGDLNWDNIISMLEANLWNVNKNSYIPSGWETPLYDDIGNIGAFMSLRYPTLICDNLYSSETHRGIIGVTKEVHVYNGQTLTLTGVSAVELWNNASLIVDEGGTLVIDGDVTFNGTHNNTLIIYGNLVQNTGSTLTFEDMEVIGYAPVFTLNGASFVNTELKYKPYNSSGLSAATTVGNLTVHNCNFYNPDKLIAILVEKSHSCDIYGNTITASGGDGICLKYSGNAVSNKVTRKVRNNEIYGCADAGLVIHATTCNVLMNDIHTNRYGVRLVGNCNVLNFKGLCSALSPTMTQYIHDNDEYEIYMMQGCNPKTMRYNSIRKTSFGTTPYLYYDNLFSTPIPDTITVILNEWGSNFVPYLHLQSNAGAVYRYLPYWVFGDCSNDTNLAEELVALADSLCEAEEYRLAKETYMQIIEDYPSTVCAVVALKALLPLESLVGEDYVTLKQYYLTDESIVGDETLAKVGLYLANRCDEALGNYDVAIAWYENVITNPISSDAEIATAIIDLGNLYLEIEEKGAKAMGKLTQYKPESWDYCTEQFVKLLSSLTGKPNETKREIEYGYWADTVTQQPEGYVVDAEGNVEIYTPEGLAWLSCVVNGLNGCEPDNFDGRTVRLMADLNLEETYGLMNLVPIGSREHRFMGTFDGQNHSIDGLFIINSLGEEMRMDMGLFGYLYHGTVKNLSLNSGFYAYMHPFDMNTGTYELYYDALVAAVADSLSVVDGCTCRLKKLEAVGNAHPGGTYMASVVGLNRNSIVRNCSYEMDRYSQLGDIDVGGIVLRNLCEGDYADAIVENCYFYGSLMGSYSDENMGGIVCFNETVSNGKNAIVRNCYSELLDYLTGHYNKGCIVAYNSEGSVVENCFADVSGQQGTNIGLFGTNNGEIVNCTDFIPSETGGVLGEDISINGQSTDELCKALNWWVHSNETGGNYYSWIVGDHSIPVFDATTTSLLENDGALLVVFPNPAINTIQVQGIEPKEIKLFNSLGQNVRTISGTNVIKVDGLQQGVYLLRIVATDGTSHVARVAVSR